MTSATFPLSVEIGAVLSSSLGAALRSAEGQLGRLGAALARLEGKSAGIARLEALRAQAAEAGQAWRRAQQEVARFQADKASGALTPKGVLAARQRVEALQAKLSDASLPESRRMRLMRQLEAAQARLAEREAQAEARHARQLERLIAQAGRAKEAFGQLKAAIAEEQAALEKAGIATGRLAAEKVKLGQALEAVKAKTQALAQAQAAQQANIEQRSAYRAQLMDAAALGASLYGLIRPAVAFESVMADVKKVVDFETPQQFAQMSKDILQLSTRIPMAAEGIGQIVAAAGQAGIAREELVRFAEDAAKMGVAFDLTGEQAGAAMTGLRTIFGLTQDEVVKLGDAINHLSNNMDARAADMLNIANRAGSTAKLFGLSGAQLNALGATFLALKTPPEVAATGINALLLKLATADKQSEKFQQALAQLGLSAKELKKNIARDAQGTLINFLEAVKGAPDVMGTLSDLFGAEYSDDIAKLVGSLDTYRQAIGLVADETAYAGSMQREYEARAATTANNLQLLKNQISRLGITIGNALLPPLNSLLGALMAPIGALAQLAERFPVITQVVVGATAAVVGFKVASIALGYAWTFVKGPFLAANTAIASVRAGLALLQVQAIATGSSAGLLSLAFSRIQTGVLGLIAPVKSAALAFWAMLPAIGATTAALLANPITWIVVGIGAAVASLALVIRKYWDPMAAYVGGVFEGIRSAVQPAISSLSTALAPLAPIGRAVASVFGFIADAVSGLVGWVSELLAPVTLSKDEFDSLSASGQSLGTVIGSVLSTAFTALTFPIRAVGTLVGWVMAGFRWLVSFSPLAALQAAWQPLSGFFGGLWGSVVSGAQSAWQQLTAVLSSPSPLQALQSVLGSMLSALGSLPGQFMSLGSAMLQGLAQGVRNAAEQAVAAVGEVAAGVRDRFKAMLGIHSPSRVFATLGSALSLGLAQGVAAAGPAVVSEVGQLAQSLQAVPLSLANPDVVSPAQGLRLPSPDRPSMGLAVPPDWGVSIRRDGANQGDEPVLPRSMRAVPSGQISTPGSPSLAAPSSSSAPHTPGAPSIHFAPQITIHAPAGADAREIARLVDERMRGLLRDQSRRVGALYD